MNIGNLVPSCVSAAATQFAIYMAQTALENCMKRTGKGDTTTFKIRFGNKLFKMETALSSSTKTSPSASTVTRDSRSSTAIFLIS